MKLHVPYELTDGDIDWIVEALNNAGLYIVPQWVAEAMAEEIADAEAEIIGDEDPTDVYASNDDIRAAIKAAP